MTNEHIVSMHKLFKSYSLAKQQVEVLKDISLLITRNTMVSIMGPSGSGKTTLLSIMGLQTSPSEGDIYIDGELISDSNRQTIRQKYIGFSFQSPHLLPQLSALHNVCLPLVPLKTTFSKEKRAAEMLDKVGLSHRIHHLPSELSGGEQQRVAVARALIHSPQLLICDEPTGNLDSTTRDSVIHLLTEIKNEGMTIVLSTHDPEVADQCDLCFNMKDGNIQTVQP
ncbi:ABC transporter ATP-binding protein [Paenibacillus larvae]|uniref:Macrolide export ATP-binding/permease protein MacB n=4 Tax=Paenibacillus larvae TaxID=1464 RepID=V9W5S9_9BACL|nr:ABC transporter ATP-binding protein [Paenibacillus larvae]AHD06366.1 macrolide export ATP-binding/permease protein MacB [Paenibacillus larvae subsp. larvae DSM 25430]AVF21569.1 macrolide export ATP-binding/permease protein MacB [Paenibacillus larvae subsp. larvae]AVG12909.1 macrolide export ATP-binding/permease protein MacB [Paenibacillus larvae subsp. larvae DSM 25430]ETK30359.1 macrolide export ATP-binding/permease protein MacB [Paenibacillus larvae subsp. larvae DSM 25719]MCY7477201.1 AB